MRSVVMQRKHSSYAMAIVAAFIVLAVAVPVSATSLLPGTSVVPTPFLDDPGALVVSAVGIPITPISGAFSGLLTAAVYRDATTGRLEFDYQFTNNAGSNDAVHRLTGFNFSGFTTDVGFRPFLPAAGPFVVPGTEPPVSADRDANGSTVGFDFSVTGGPATLAIDPGETSFILAIKTDAPDWTTGFASVIDGGAQTVPAFQPAGQPIPPADVPEPATLLLVGSAVIGMGAAVRRRSQR
jgi:PEP-CTERM motif-containing protein